MDPSPTPPARADLLPSLGRLVRGLILLFWAVPLSLVLGVQTARTTLLAGAGILPPVLALALVVYGVSLMAAFQPRERIWVRALDRVRVLALINLGLAPFLHWWRLMPEVTHYQIAVAVLAAGGLAFLAALNAALRRLGAMLPDETLRLEVRLFTNLNLGLLAALALCGLLLKLGPALGSRAAWSPLVLELWLHLGSAFLLVLALLPVALTMTLLWKIKEAILTSVFHPHNQGLPGSGPGQVSPGTDHHHPADRAG